MLTVHTKIVVDEAGQPTDVILPWGEYQEIAELLGFDLDSEAREDLMQGKKDREAGRMDAYVELGAL